MEQATAGIIEREIPKSEWQSYLSQVEARSKGEKVHVEMLGEDLGDQPLVTEAELKGIGLDKSEEGPVVEMHLGREEQLDHRVIHPKHVYISLNPSGELHWIDIEDADQTQTLVRFDPPLKMPAM